ncbi:hypothetical protein DFH08DRAFT_976462 [Mycena albidolilacea]|uniref:Uncharacterized protein n=1 Tax=Mycena albidolilacea TaxID=1033008 RepID=A0AAD6Z370_9AGAR|nr:hypothetical protein DFH08DRAFT_976462 [Mycena albidolilacea]
MFDRGQVTVFPVNAKIIAEGAPAVPPGLFNANTTGHVTPVGEFFGFQDSFEYFFGLVPLPSGSPSNGAISKATLAEYPSTVYLTLSTINLDNLTGPFITILKEIAFWCFDDSGIVLYYDAWIPNLDLFSPLIHGFDIYTLDRMNQIIQGICGLETQTCVGPNTVYDGVDDCVRTLAAKPFGRFDQRQVHCTHSPD